MGLDVSITSSPSSSCGRKNRSSSDSSERRSVPKFSTSTLYTNVMSRTTLPSGYRTTREGPGNTANSSSPTTTSPDSSKVSRRSASSSDSSTSTAPPTNPHRPQPRPPPRGGGPPRAH